MEFVVVDAPFKCMDEPPKELRRFMPQNQENCRFRSWFLFPTWGESDRAQNLSPECVYGLEEVSNFLADFLEKQGPFDGVLAFS
jgi:hypothetical protein